MTAQEILLTCQTKGIKLELTEEGKLEAIGQLNDDLRSVIKENLFDIKFFLLQQQTLQRLPWELERLVDAASSNLLNFEKRGISNTNSYVMAWACTYLTSDKDEALNRLWGVYSLWKKQVN